MELVTIGDLSANNMDEWLCRQIFRPFADRAVVELIVTDGTSSMTNSGQTEIHSLADYCRPNPISFAGKNEVLNRFRTSKN